MKPMTASTPCRFSSWASSSILYDFPTPGAAPMYTRSRARPSSLARARSDSATEGVSAMLFSHRVLRVEREVELEHIHDGFTQKPQLPSLSVFGDQPADLLHANAPLARDAGHLERRRGRGDVRVEPRRRRGDEIDRDGRVSVVLPGLDDRGLDGVDQLLVGRPEIRS